MYCFTTLPFLLIPLQPPSYLSRSFSLFPISSTFPFRSQNFVNSNQTSFRFLLRYRNSSDYFFEESSDEDCRFDRAVSLFNSRDFYKCHDFLEALWNRAEEPRRTLIHGILQCAVGLHHLFNQNHRGAMMELGEGVCKIRKMNFTAGPFHQFEQEISAALDFIYQTQLELAACTEDFCLQMDGSERSYQLLGSFAAGQHLYSLESGMDDVLYIVFSPEGLYSLDKPPRVKIPTLNATEEHLKA
ncbi:uncharacterized protein LOC143863524 isoform X2 [Tasmannia lanceolata]